LFHDDDDIQSLSTSYCSMYIIGTFFSSSNGLLGLVIFSLEM